MDHIPQHFMRTRPEFSQAAEKVVWRQDWLVLLAGATDSRHSPCPPWVEKQLQTWPFEAAAVVACAAGGDMSCYHCWAASLVHFGGLKKSVPLS